MDQSPAERLYVTALSIVAKIRNFKRCWAERYENHRAAISFACFLLCGCYVPVVLLWSGIIPFAYRFHTMYVVLALYGMYLYYRRYRFKELGYTTDHLGSALFWNFIFFVFGGVCMYLASQTPLLRLESGSYLPYGYACYVLFIAPVQELIFRGIFFAEMRRAGIVHQGLAVIVSALSFCFLHIIYNDLLLLIISFVGGLIWGTIFIRWPNAWGVTLSHSLLGALAMFLGVI